MGEGSPWLGQQVPFRSWVCCPGAGRGSHRQMEKVVIKVSAMFFHLPSLI